MDKKCKMKLSQGGQIYAQKDILYQGLKFNKDLIKLLSQFSKI
jgi:hypothetical protein